MSAPSLEDVNPELWKALGDPETRNRCMYIARKFRWLEQVTGVTPEDLYHMTVERLLRPGRIGTWQKDVAPIAVIIKTLNSVAKDEIEDEIKRIKKKSPKEIENPGVDAANPQFSEKTKNPPQEKCIEVPIDDLAGGDEEPRFCPEHSQAEIDLQWASLITKLDPKDREMVDLIRYGYKQCEIAIKIGKSDTYVSLAIKRIKCIADELNGTM